ncbi:MAG: iron-containing alcohol dehydrogenase [Magnetococcales bacterium]|nr:iron-containing alcohol dehydrogenase [Magnetococcales bacterium]
MGFSRIKTLFPVPRLLANPDLFAGRHALMALKGIGSSRTLLLTGGSLQPEKRAEIKKMLQAESVIDVVRSQTFDPDWHQVETILQSLAGKVPDLIIAVGGGAVLDLAKLVLLKLTWPEATPERITRPFAAPPLKNHIRLCAIPTTAGSGAEVSSSALVLDQTSQSKSAIVTHDFIYDVVLLDPRFLSGIPRSVMLAGVIDAMTHAVEGTISNVDNPLADALAETSLERLGRLALHWLQDESNLEIILQLQFAAHLAGMVQNQCGVGICHSLAHQLARFAIGHGEANGVFLARVLAFNSAVPQVAERLHRLQTQIGFSIAERVGELQSAAGMATQFQDLRSRMASRGTAVAPAVLGRDALADICTRFNPRPVDAGQLTAFFQEGAPGV